MKVIFLDIDGVLNSEQWCDYATNMLGYEHGYGGFFLIGDEVTKENVCFDPVTVRWLKWLTDMTDAKIIISSTWREHHPLHRFHEMFALYDVEFDIIGMTPVMGNFEPYATNYEQSFRGDEINRCLALGPTVHDYVILDDGTDFYEDQPLIQVNPDVGLMNHDVEAAYRKLTGRWLE